MSATKKKNKKVEILETHVRIRKKVLSQNVSIVFTSNRKRPLNDIVQELCDYIDSNPLPEHCESFIRNRIPLIGRRVKHSSMEKLHVLQHGTVAQSKIIHLKKRCRDTEEYHFDLTIDLLLGDIIYFFTIL